MKFKIRYADQIVGFFSIFALIVLMVLVFALGAKQNWFVRKNVYYTQFESGSSIKAGMDITYKGFGIGKIKNIQLQNDQVVVEFYILDDYMDYVKEYSLLEFSSNILGLGTSFVWHPGKGQGFIEPGSEVYRYDSREGMKIREKRLIDGDKGGDSITAIIDKVEPLLDTVTRLLRDIDDGITGNVRPGRNGEERKNEMAEMILHIKGITENVEVLTRDITVLTAKLGGDAGAVAALLGDDGWKSIEEILVNVNELLSTVGGIGDQAGTLLENTTPQLDSTLGQIDTLLLELQDVLTGVKNNPLIKKGVPDRSQETSATPNLRAEEF
ncbi:MAG: MlaD family protein [Treponema sp.]|nr:MlaD family protein [Treponema sp.]